MKNSSRKEILVVLSWQIELSHTIHQGICDYARLHPDWETRLISIRDLTHVDVAQWGSSGMIASLGGDRYKKLMDAKFPIVSTFAGKGVPKTILQVDEDHLKSGELAADYLQSLGHENFACVHPVFPAHPTRAKGFLQRLQENGQDADMLEIQQHGFAGEEKRVGQWLHDLPKPTALFVTEDTTARSLLKLCLDTRLAVPDDVAILGCENNRSLCEGITPAISSIQLPYYRIGYEAAHLLDQKMQGKKIKSTKLLFPPERIVTRASTDILASPDPHLRRAIRYIRDHVDEKIEVRDIARHAGLSLRVLQGRFRDELKRTPMEEIQYAKVERTKELLFSTALTLDEIAEHTGFSSAYYLGRIFKRYAKITPGQYRKQHCLR